MDNIKNNLFYNLKYIKQNKKTRAKIDIFKVVDLLKYQALKMSLKHSKNVEKVNLSNFYILKI